MPVKVTAILHPDQPVRKQRLPLSERRGQRRLIRRIVVKSRDVVYDVVV
ncbi:hypothetical protein [Mycobacteroides abscessus]|nr:hypothetical protein [Mycobacteroides abscessus]